VEAWVDAEKGGGGRIATRNVFNEKRRKREDLSSKFAKATRRRFRGEEKGGFFLGKRMNSQGAGENPGCLKKNRMLVDTQELGLAGWKNGSFLIFIYQ